MAAIRVIQGAPATLPLLHNGDRLDVETFLRRYNAMPDLKKAELIDGVVYMSSAVSINHGGPHGILITWLGMYRMATPGIELLDNTTVILSLGENCPQPDGCLRVLPGYGGQSKSSAAGYVVGGPELAAEVSVSSVSYDLHAKLKVYERNGIQEYVVWCVEDRSINWFVLRDGEYRPLAARGGVFRSKACPGLWLDAAAMLQEDFAQVRRVADQGVASTEHRRFVARLAKRKAAGE
jgi:Uma2 family endonuclease